jgi:hypothetical protein
MIRINQQDKDYITTSKVIDLTSQEKLYLGGEFGSNEKDHIQLLINDENENFLESIILHTDDYTFDTGKIKMKTGTILRKAGYDRGRFILKFLFLRHVAGSGETVLVKQDGQIFGKASDEVFDKNNPADMRRITGAPGILPDLTIKDNKYWVEEISGTRTEVRIIPQNITDKGYIKDFYDMQNIKSRLTSAQDNLPGVQFTGVGAETGDSTEIIFTGTQSMPQEILTRGRIYIPNVFVTSVTPPPEIYNVGDARKEPIEAEAVDLETTQACFYLSSQLQARELAVQGSSLPFQFDYIPGTFGDRYFESYQTLFRDFNSDVQNNADNAYTANFASDQMIMSRFKIKDVASELQIPENILKPNNIYWHAIRPMIFENTNDVKTYIEFSSNSVLARQKDDAGVDVPNDDANTTFTNQPTNYYWRVVGWDYDKKGGSGGKGWNKVRPGGQGVGDFQIVQNVPSGDFPNVGPQNSPIASMTNNPYQAQTLDSQNGSSLRITINSLDVWIGIGLTVVQNTNEGQNRSTFFAPACILCKGEVT